MYVTVTQYPQSLEHYAKNTVPAFIIETDEMVTVIVKCWQANDYENFDWTDAETVFQGNYIPDFFNVVTVDFSDCYADYVKTNLPSASSNVVSHTEAATYFKAGIYNAAGTLVGMYQWFVCNALLNSTTPFETWSQQNFLSNQPIEKKTNCESPEWLTYLDLTEYGNNVLKVRFYKKAGGYEEATVRTDTAPGCYSVNVSYQRVIQMVNVLPGTLWGYYDLILFTNGGTEICRQRYVLDERTGLEKYFLFINALGGIDTLICPGENVLQPETTHNIGRFDDRYRALDNTDDQRKWTQNIGMVPTKYRDWVYELLTAKQGAQKYDPAAMDYYEIVVDTSTISMSDKGQLASSSFGYIYNKPVDVMRDTERAVDRSMHQSVADEAEEMEDMTKTVVLSFSDDGIGGYETDVINIEATKFFIMFAKAASSRVVYIYIDGSERGQFNTFVDASPIVVPFGVKQTLQLKTAAAGQEPITIKYYGENLEA